MSAYQYGRGRFRPGFSPEPVFGKKSIAKHNADVAAKKAAAEADAAAFVERVKARKVQPPPRWLGKGPEDEA